MATSYESAEEYIKHHLTNLTFGQKADGSWGIAHGQDEIAEMGFWAINIDSMIFSIGLGVLFLWGFRRAAVRASTDAPTGWQNFVEMIIEFIDESVRSSYSGKSKLVAPLALTIFVWIFLLNLMDLVAVDLVPWLAALSGIPYMKIVPTTDPNITFGLSLTVFFLILYYSLKFKGPGGFFAELAFHPLPKFMMPVNLVLEGVTLLARPISLSFHPHRGCQTNAMTMRSAEQAE